MDTGATDEPKKMITPGLIRPRLLLLKKNAANNANSGETTEVLRVNLLPLQTTMDGIQQRVGVPSTEKNGLSTTNTNNTNTNTTNSKSSSSSSNITKAESNLPIKISNEPTTFKRPSLLKIKITDKVTAKPKASPSVHTSGISLPPIQSGMSTSTLLKPAPSIKRPIPPTKSDNALVSAITEKDEDDSDENHEGPSLAIIPVVSNSGFRIMSESTATKDNFAPPDTHPVRLTPIIIAGVGYFICHENKCLYCPNTEEKLGIILPNRSISWYQAQK